MPYSQCQFRALKSWSNVPVLAFPIDANDNIGGTLVVEDGKFYTRGQKSKFIVPESLPFKFNENDIVVSTFIWLADKVKIDTFDAMNVEVEELPKFNEIGKLTYQMLEKTAKYVLRSLALHLGLEETYFDNYIKNGNSILRPIYYYPLDPETTDPKAVRAAQHGDINLITLLMGASADGLQVLRRDGEWIGVTSLPKQVVVNVGDMLDRHTNNRLKSTIHRVVNPPKEKMNTERFSIPFFMHPRSEMDLTCLENCVSEANPKQYEDINAGDFLAERLAEIGFGKKK